MESGMTWYDVLGVGSRPPSRVHRGDNLIVRLWHPPAGH